MRVSQRESSAVPPLPAAGAREPAPIASSASPAGGQVTPAFADVLRRMGRALDQGEAAMRRATASWASGSDLNDANLLVLQAGAYRYGEMIDVASRFVDRAASSVKTVLQGSNQ
jgi:hypothetical protein